MAFVVQKVFRQPFFKDLLWAILWKLKTILTHHSGLKYTNTHVKCQCRPKNVYTSFECSGFGKKDRARGNGNVSNRARDSELTHIKYVTAEICVQIKHIISFIALLCWCYGKRHLCPGALCLMHEMRNGEAMFYDVGFDCFQMFCSTWIECFSCVSTCIAMVQMGIYFILYIYLPILHHLEIYLYNFTCFEFWDFQSGFRHDIKLDMRKKLLIHITMCIIVYVRHTAIWWWRMEDGGWRGL